MVGILVRDVDERGPCFGSSLRAHEGQALQIAGSRMTLASVGGIILTRSPMGTRRDA